MIPGPARFRTATAMDGGSAAIAGANCCRPVDLRWSRSTYWYQPPL